MDFLVHLTDGSTIAVALDPLLYEHLPNADDLMEESAVTVAGDHVGQDVGHLIKEVEWL